MFSLKSLLVVTAIASTGAFAQCTWPLFNFLFRAYPSFSGQSYHPSDCWRYSCRWYFIRYHCTSPFSSSASLIAQIVDRHDSRWIGQFDPPRRSLNQHWRRWTHRQRNPQQRLIPMEHPHQSRPRKWLRRPNHRGSRVQCIQRRSRWIQFHSPPHSRQQFHQYSQLQ